MAMSVPYPDSKSAYKGNLTESQDVLNTWCERVHRAGIQNVEIATPTAMSPSITC